MPQYNAPGVYIENQKGAPAPIAGVSASALGLVGFTPKGFANLPTLVQSYGEFKEKFGDFTADSLTPTCAFLFFQNGGKQAYVVRVLGASSKVSTGVFGETASELRIGQAGGATAIYTFATIGGVNSAQGGAIGDPSTPDKLPIKKASVTLTGNLAAGGTSVLTDDGLGVLKNGAGEVKGAIDYVTGNITAATFSGAIAAGADQIAIAYSYRTYDFDMLWPGKVGDSVRVSVSGDPQFEDPKTASFSKFKVVVEEKVSGVWTPKETFGAVNMIDPTDANAIAAVLNDDANGSDYVKVTAWPSAKDFVGGLAGTKKLASGLTGSGVLAEKSVSDASAFDGVDKQFEFRASGQNTNLLEHKVHPGTFKMELRQAIQNEVVDAGPADAVSTTFEFVLKHKPRAAINDVLGNKSIRFSTKRASDSAAIVGLLDLTTTPPTFSGDLTAGSCVFEEGGVANKVKLVWGVAVKQAEPTVAQYQSVVTIIDDGVGGLKIDSTSKSTANSLTSGQTNKIEYDAGTGKSKVTVTFSIAPPTTNIGATAKTDAWIVQYYTAPSATQLQVQLAGGSDGDAVKASDVVGASLVDKKEGLYALSRNDELMSVLVADFQTDITVGQALVDYCELRQDRFAILSVPKGRQYAEAVAFKKLDLAKNSSYAALYYPHVKYIDPVTDKTGVIPPGAWVAGIMARTDAAKNVGKSPAGVEDGKLVYSSGLEIDLTIDQVGTAYENRINCLVQWPQTGRVVWGARTLGQDEYKYVSHRRGMMFVGKSLFSNMHIHVFENNGAALWGSVKVQVTNWLTNLFNQGYFAGTKPSEAFYVVVDGGNNPPALVEQGYLYVDVGIAWAAPAEFLVFRLKKKLGE